MAMLVLTELSSIYPRKEALAATPTRKDGRAATTEVNR
jgi:hypothetical protein